ncbi:MAG: YegS/Rv2252/BmrU family lipid kinase [Candidatus Planktophila sp.]|nr:YegS/Rv2252/BmrU family lipid kinase [Candidatus Planktophila sp.]
MWAIVVNPVSGGGKGAALGREVAGYFANKSFPHRVITSTTAQGLHLSLQDFLDLHVDDCQGVVAVGGDGLAHLVMQLVIPRSIPFTVIPAGTGNDFVRALGWSLVSITKQLDFVTTKRASKIDLGLVDSEWFGAVLSTGFDSVVNEKANRMNWPKGSMKYIAAIAMELPRFKPMQYTIGLDNNSIQTEAMLIAVANGSSYGAGMLVCPGARIDDGLFDVMVLRPVSKLEFIKVFPKVFKGAHIDHPMVDIYRSKRVSLAAPAIAYADGERVGTLPVQAECIAGAGLSWTP